MMKRVFLMVFVGLLLCAANTQAAPTITNDLPLTGPGTTQALIVDQGQLTVNLTQDGVAAGNVAQLFLERSNFVLSNNLTLTTGGVLSAGTVVNSYIVHFDPVGAASTPVWECRGTVIFDQAVLGLIYANNTSSSALTASDVSVGLGAGFYDSNVSHRKLETDSDYDVLQKWEDVAMLPGNTVYLNLFTNSSMDEVRIITQGVVVPAPGAILLGGLGAGLVGWLRRRRAL